jgi:hypothetical protein
MKTHSHIWDLGLDLETVQPPPNTRCSIHPCTMDADVKLKEPASLLITFNCGAATGMSYMNFCRGCFEKHTEKVETARERKHTEIRYFIKF